MCCRAPADLAAVRASAHVWLLCIEDLQHIKWMFSTYPFYRTFRLVIFLIGDFEMFKLAEQTQISLGTAVTESLKQVHAWLIVVIVGQIVPFLFTLNKSRTRIAPPTARPSAVTLNVNRPIRKRLFHRCILA